MYRNHTIAVVVPAYNEEVLLARVIELLLIRLSVRNAVKCQGANLSSEQQ